MKNNLVRTWLALIISVFLISVAAQATPLTFVYQGQIIKPDALALEAASVNFTIQVVSPGAEECILFEENHTLNMSGSNGLFSLKVGSGTRAGADFEDTSVLTQIFDNSVSTWTPTNCVGVNYTPASGDSRKLRVTFDDGGGPVTLANDQVIQSVPYAQYASTVDGLSSSDILQVNMNAPAVLSQANLEWVFEAARFPELQALISGTSTQYMVSSPGSAVNFNGQVIDNIAAPVDGNDATRKDYVDTRIGGQTADALVTTPTAVQDGYVITWNNATGEYELQSTSGDNFGNHTATSNVIMGANFISNDGAVSQGLSFTGVNDANFSQNLTVSQGFSVTNGINSGGHISALAESEIRLEDNAGGEYMGLKSPATVTTSTTLTLPDGDGGANQVLGTDGSGQLQWQNDSAPVDTVFGRSGTVVAATSDYDAIQVDNTAAGSVAATNVQAAIDELDTEKLALAGGNMTGTLQLDASNEIRFADADSSNYVGFVSPAILGGDQVWVLPGADGGANQVLATDSAGNLFWKNDNDTTAPVTSVHGRTGVVVGANGDYTASNVTNVNIPSFWLRTAHTAQARSQEYFS